MPIKIDVDWDEVDRRLPTSHRPECRARRKEIFKEMDPSGNMKLSITECMAGIPHLMEGDIVPILDFRQAIKCAFACARDLEPSKKKKARRNAVDTSVDPTEFHALLVAFRQYLELAVLFQATDKDGNALLNYHEAKPALPLLEKWGLSQKQVRAKFPDEWEQVLKFDDFADWCISSAFRGGLNLALDDSDNEEVQMAAAAAVMTDAAGCTFGDAKAGKTLEEAQNERKVREAFSAWDTDHSGTISEEEVAVVLMKLNDKFSREDITALFKAADGNKDGVVDYEEFTQWLFK